MISFDEWQNSKESAMKQGLLQHWQSLRPNIPISIRPTPHHKKGTGYVNESVRLTGTPQFIDSILSRIKDLLAFENPTTRIEITMKPVKNQSPGSNAYNLYVSVETRKNPALPDSKI